ncbi:MAG: aldehyde dehydrogenase [Bacteroidales bacterium]|nr:aldehyde dehydrogenase [Bacteroidales bacterium]
MGIINTPIPKIQELVSSQKEFFLSGATLHSSFRLQQLNALSNAIDKYSKRLYEALWTDLHKSEQESFLTEISIVQEEIRDHVKHLHKWTRPERASSVLKMFPSKSKVVKEPLGNTLIIAPWNYPVNLLLTPLVGAISSGCTAILKPSPYVENVSTVIEEMISEIFPENYIAVVQGDRNVNTALLEQRFDLIFFTGSPALGKVVMSAAARNLTPVILELGGKSPCIVDTGADVAVAAKRIAWGKTLNAGQTCIAPDYLLIQENLRAEFIEAYRKALKELHGKDITKSRHYVRMVSQKAFDRVSSYLSCGTALIGGMVRPEDRYIEPTLLEDVSLDSPVMQEEIFGPVLPMITFKTTEDVIDFVKHREKPLALYYFGLEEVGMRVIENTSSGGACINDVIMHFTNPNVPFGGVGNSGMGCYHSKRTFDAFTHYRAVITTTTHFNPFFRYMPYRMFSLVKKLL